MRSPDVAAASDEDALSSPLTVFIAEDDKAAASSLADLLMAQGGIEIAGIANSEMTAADWLMNQASATDLLITDLLLLPGGSGFGVIAHAKKLGTFRRVVVFSSFVTAAVAEKCAKLGASAVFNKAQLEELLQYVRSQRPRSEAARP